jgi:valine dehydrogenase (NAD+)
MTGYDVQNGAAGGLRVFSTDHEQVVFCHDRPTGLRAIIGIYSTALGPALGGTRFYPYHSEDAALADVLALSQGMAYKNSLAGLDLGGGKAVIIGDPEQVKSEALLRAYGRFVESLGGRYYTACDVGTYVEDMDVIARESRFVTGRSPAYGGAGDSSVLTAFGVFQGMLASAEHVWGSTSLTGRRVGVAGVGKVGRHLIEHLLADGASVVISDVKERAIEAVTAQHPEVDVAVDTDSLVRQPLDVYAPCALGFALDDEVTAALTAKIVCGAANNQLAHVGMDKALADRGILYAPDYLVEDEIHGFNPERARQKAARIFDTTRRVFDIAAAEGVPPAAAADRLAERRIAEIGRLRTIRLS